MTATIDRIPTLTTLVWRSLTNFRALHVALAAGIAAATAVIVGALVVGDSVRGSLRGLVNERMGRIELTMQSQKFFDPTILSGSGKGIQPVELEVLPIIDLPSVAVELRRDGALRRASQVRALGIDAGFWRSATHEKAIQATQLGKDEVALSAALASTLGARVGDEVTIRFPKGVGVPPDSPLGRRDEASASLPLQRVAVILPAHGLGDIDFRAGQQVTRNIFVPRAELADALEQPGKVNGAIAVAPHNGPPLPLDQAQLLCDQMNTKVLPSLSDYGLKLSHHKRVFPDAEIGETGEDPPKAIFDYYQITSDQLILDDLALNELFKGLEPYQPQRAMSYLVNQITSLDEFGREQPTIVTYSIAIGMDDMVGNSPSFGPFEQRPSTCWVNSWLAERMNLKVGSRLRIAFFKPETTDGRETETEAELEVVDIVRVTTPSSGYVRNRPARFKSPPEPFNDPDMTPVVPGITDQDSISKWDLPFKLTREVPDEDDQYWKDFRLTPKIFLRYGSAARNFGSRFGSATAIRIDASRATEGQIRQRAIDSMLHAKAGYGIQFVPTRQLLVRAASGTTPFDGLFLALSFFVIVAALMLVALLFRLSIEQRASQFGLLLATGFTHSRVRNLLLRESATIVFGGAGLGILLGLGYARLMIAGLESLWLGAISISFLSFSFSLKSLFLGGGLGSVASLATIVGSLRRLDRKAPLDLLRGRWESSAHSKTQSKVSLAIAGFLTFGAAGLLTLGMTQTGMAQAGSFFGCGMMLLGAAITAMMYVLRGNQLGQISKAKALPGLLALSWRSLSRNPWRSVLTLGLLSTASFLIASMSIFQMSPEKRGSGGYELMAQSSLPIYRDPGSIRVREDLLNAKDFETLRSVNILSFRARIGEDASCNNLYQVAQPTILGVPDSLDYDQESLAESSRFQWVDSLDKQRPWQELMRRATGSEQDPIPAVVDMNTAAWSLHQGASVGSLIKIPFDDRILYFKTVGLLSNSVLQGKLLIGQKNFGTAFPEQNGFRFFLIHVAEMSMESVSEAIENGWSDEGVDVSSTEETLAKLLAVQNTYISAFQSIGALGLLLGTIGLAVVQVRSVLERRRELALMQAIGFSRSRIAKMLMVESLMLLGGGLLVGVSAALIAIIPYVLGNDTQANIVDPFIMLGIVLSVGIAAGGIAIRTALRQPVLQNLQ